MSPMTKALLESIDLDDMFVPAPKGEDFPELTQEEQMFLFAEESKSVGAKAPAGLEEKTR